MDEKVKAPEDLYVVVVREPEGAALAATKPAWERINSDRFKGGLESLVAVFQSALGDIEKHVSQFELTEVDVAVMVDAQGQVGIPGLGSVGLETSGTLTLSFTKKKDGQQSG